MKIGIFGGTFDPPHKGHLAFAEAALAKLELDEVLFIPANRNPLKRDKRQASARDRLEMVRLMAEENSKFAVSDIEIARGGPSYTIETLEQLQYVQPAEYWFLVGADALKGFDTWKQPEKLLRLCRLGVAVRHPENLADILSMLDVDIREKVDEIPMHPVEISATDIRIRLAKKQSVAPWLVPAVLKYIQDHRLYEN